MYNDAFDLSVTIIIFDMLYIVLDVADIRILGIDDRRPNSQPNRGLRGS